MVVAACAASGCTQDAGPTMDPDAATTAGDAGGEPVPSDGDAAGEPVPADGDAGTTVGSESFGRIHHENFESGALGDVLGEDANHAGVQVLDTGYDSGTAHSGTYCAAMNWTSNGYSGLRRTSWSYRKEFFIRFWARLDADVDPVWGAKILRLGFNSSDGTSTPKNDFTIQRDGAFHETLYSEQAIAANNWSAYDMNDNRWHKFEIYLYEDDVNGVFKFWFDGQLETSTWPYHGDTHVTDSAWDTFYLPSNWSNFAHDDANHIYLDDFEIYSDTGTGGKGSMVDGSAAVAP